MRRLVLGALLAALPASAWANGRPPQTMNLHIRPGSDADVLAAATFGALLTDDHGDTWHWICETAVGYGGTYDPDYAITATGTVFATTFDGLQMMRPGTCAFVLSPLGVTFAASVTVAPDGTVHTAVSTPGDPTAVPPLPPDYKLYRSTDDGVTFDAGITVGVGGEWWQSIEVAPSDPTRVYLTGYKVMAGQMKQLYLYRSDNGGQSYAPLSVAPFTVTERSDLEIAAISRTDPDRVLLRVTWWSDVIGDELYLTTNAGQTWTSVLRLPNSAHGVVFRANGDAVAATPGSGIYRSTDGGQTFTMVPGPQPDVTCLRENGAGELWACTSNYAQPPFGYGIMKTTDLATWTGVAHFQDDIVGPVDCPVGTIQNDCCETHTPACPVMNTPSWCLLAVQLGIMDPACAVPDAAIPDAGPGGENPKVCCGAADPTSSALLALLVALGLSRRRPRARLTRPGS